MLNYLPGNTSRSCVCASRIPNIIAAARFCDTHAFFNAGVCAPTRTLRPRNSNSVVKATISQTGAEFFTSQVRLSQVVPCAKMAVKPKATMRMRIVFLGIFDAGPAPVLQLQQPARSWEPLWEETFPWETKDIPQLKRFMALFHSVFLRRIADLLLYNSPSFLVGSLVEISTHQRRYIFP